MSFVILPAVDVSEGQAIRLTQGLEGTEQSYGSPVESALNWQSAGAKWLHLVDLDAAFGKGSNAAILSEVISQMSLKVELSGGIRDTPSLETALATGAHRVNIGTAALENPQWCGEVLAEYGEKVAVGLDTQYVDGQWRVKARGWVKDGGDLWESLDRLNSQNCSRYIVTDVSKDGMLNGPNLELLSQVLERTEAQVIASGGVSSLIDIEKLAALRTPSGKKLEGSIVGKALYAKKFTLEAALAIVQ